MLALLFDEPGAERVAELVGHGAVTSAVNLSEVATVLVRRDLDPERVLGPLRAQVAVEPFTDTEALAAAELYPLTSSKGLSLGDRACLALARRLDQTAVTAERAWAELGLDVRIELLRPGTR